MITANKAQHALVVVEAHQVLVSDQVAESDQGMAGTLLKQGEVEANS
jgi:hypothetical protein